MNLHVATRPGDVEACERLYRTYHPLALNIARQCSRSYADAEDAAQLVFVWLLTGRWRLDPATVTDGGRLHGFIRCLAVFASWRKDRVITSDADEDDLTISMLRLRSKFPSPEAALLARELRQRIHDAIRTFPRQYQRVVRLRYYGELSGPAIAERVGVHPTTIPTYLVMIRKKLRADLVNYGIAAIVGLRAHAAMTERGDASAIAC